MVERRRWDGKYWRTDDGAWPRVYLAGMRFDPLGRVQVYGDVEDEDGSSPSHGGSAWLNDEETATVTGILIAALRRRAPLRGERP